jgi:hypothetical protein
MDTLLRQALQAAAFRDADRNPPRPKVDAPPTPAKRSRFARVAHPFHHHGAVAPAA